MLGRKFRAAAAALAVMFAGNAAFAMSATVTVSSTINANGTTSFQMLLCVCLNAAEVAALQAANPDGTFDVTLMVGNGGIQVVDNDPIDDDELGDDGGFVGAGAYGSPSLSTAGVQPCPPAPVSFCTPIGPIVTVPSGSYGNEVPGDFQWGDGAGNEGVVPPGTSVNLPPCGSCTPTFP